MKRNVFIIGMLFSSMAIWAEFPATYTGTPNNPNDLGNPHAIPCVIEAEWYDNGGEGVAYQSQMGGFGIDTSCPGSTDNKSLNKINSGDPSYNTNAGGDWMCYTISSSITQKYNIAIKTRYNANNSATFKVYLDDEEVSGNVTIYAKGSWNCDAANWLYQLVPDQVEIPAGTHVLKIQFTKGFPNFDYISIYTGVAKNPNNPGNPHVLPCVIEAEWYDYGGEMVSYHAQRAGGFGIDGSCSDATRGTSLNNINNNNENNSGDWMSYTISSPTEQYYNIALNTRYQGNGTEASFRVWLDNLDISGVVACMGGGNWDCGTNWINQFVPNQVLIPAGEHVLKVEFTKGFPNFDYISIYTGKAKNPKSWGNPHTIPGKIEAEWYDNGGNGVAFGSQKNAAGFKRDNCGARIGVSGRCSIAEINNDQQTGKDDWATYTFTNPTAARFDIVAKIRYGFNGGKFKLSIDGTQVGAEATIINGGWGGCSTSDANDINNWKDNTVSGVVIPAGEHVLRVDFTYGKPNVDYFMFNFIETVPTGLADVAYVAGKAYMKDNVLTLSGYSASASVEVFNLVGQRISAVRADKQITLSKGIYLVKVRDSGRTETHKVLAQ